MRIQKAVLAAVALSLGLPVQSSSASKPPSSIATSGTFGLDGQLGSDGLGPYFDKVDGVQSIIDSSPGNLHFCVGYYQSRTPREAYVDLNFPAALDSGALGVSQNDSFCFNIIRIRDMAVGEVKQTPAGLGFIGGWDGVQHALEFGFAGSTGLLSNPLQVTRISNTQWFIEAVPGSIAELVTRERIQGNWQYTHVGTYLVSFSLTINSL